MVCKQLVKKHAAINHTTYSLKFKYPTSVNRVSILTLAKNWVSNPKNIKMTDVHTDTFKGCLTMLEEEIPHVLSYFG